MRNQFLFYKMQKLTSACSVGLVLYMYQYFHASVIQGKWVFFLPFGHCNTISASKGSTNFDIMKKSYLPRPGQMIIQWKCAFAAFNNVI